VRSFTRKHLLLVLVVLAALVWLHRERQMRPA